MQRLTPQHLHGRLMGAVESLGAVSLAVGLSLGGILVALSSPRVAFLVVGLGAMASTAVFLRLTLIGFDTRRGDGADHEAPRRTSPPATAGHPREPASK